MERHSAPSCKTVWALVVVLSGVAGCQQVGIPSVLPGMAVELDEPSGKLKPKQAADVQIALARSMELHGEAERAMAMYDEAVKKDPTRGDAWRRMAILHDQQGQFAESAAMYQKALKCLPGNAEIYCDMGYSLYLQRRWSEAEINLRQALAIQPDLARAHNNLGLLLAHTGKDEESLDEFHKAGCSDAEARVNLAFALTLERRLPEARSKYQEALRADPASAPAKKGLQELEQLIARMETTAPSSLTSSTPPSSTKMLSGANNATSLATFSSP